MIMAERNAKHVKQKKKKENYKSLSVKLCIHAYTCVCMSVYINISVVGTD